MLSVLWSTSPDLLACGHLAEGLAGFAWADGVSRRECFRCGRELGEDARWQEVVVSPSDVALIPAP